MRVVTSLKEKRVRLVQAVGATAHRLKQFRNVKITNVSMSTINHQKCSNLLTKKDIWKNFSKQAAACTYIVLGGGAMEVNACTSEKY